MNREIENIERVERQEGRLGLVCIERKLRRNVESGKTWRQMYREKTMKSVNREKWCFGGYKGIRERKEGKY